MKNSGVSADISRVIGFFASVAGVTRQRNSQTGLSHGLRPWRTALLKSAAVAFASTLIALTVQASPALADDPPTCGHKVGGEILKKYQEGEIAKKLGCPATDELTNPDGQGKRQQFDGGTIYWHPTLSHGAHPVWGKIGQLWADYGWETGAFGYPTSDEGWDQEYKSWYQRFSTNNLTLFWSSGNGVEGCKGECVGYSGITGTDLFKETRVEIPVGTKNVVVRAFPTTRGTVQARVDPAGAWKEMWSLAPYPHGVSKTENSSLYKQFVCHAVYDVPTGGGDGTSGISWDLESWHADVSWARVLNPLRNDACDWK
ncbi:hypothetical protein ACFCVY_22605 [Streptomyces sp. NPDC056411]|uniref:hypothetical protein n=1 Tax=Streptomyces sp. NPDC056411 TaxID=3345813 RepID=UPI0035D5F9AD